MESTAGEKVRTTATAWLEQAGWSLEDIEPSQAAAWAIRAGDASGRSCLVWQVEGEVDHLVVEGSFRPEEAHRASVEALPRESQESLLWELRLGLLEMSLDFQGVDLSLERILLFRSVYVDERLPKDTFFERLDAIRRGTAWLQFTFRQQFPALG
jgi:hypothetical protein